MNSSGPLCLTHHGFYFYFENNVGKTNKTTHGVTKLRMQLFTALFWKDMRDGFNPLRTKEHFP